MYFFYNITFLVWDTSNTPFISPNSQSLRTELHFQFIRFAAAILQCTSVCFHTEHRISAFWKVRFKKRSKIEQKDIITPMHCLAFPSALFGAPFHIDNRTVADCGFWLEYASKTPLEVVADLPHRMRLFWLRCQIMRLRSVHIKPHYSQNAFDSALLAWYERGIRMLYGVLFITPVTGLNIKLALSQLPEGHSGQHHFRGAHMPNY